MFMAHCMLICLRVSLLRHNDIIMSYPIWMETTLGWHICLSQQRQTWTLRHRSCDITVSYLCVCHQRLCHSPFPLLPLFASRGVQAQRSCPGSLVGTCSGLYPLYRSQWTGMQTGLVPEGNKQEERTKIIYIYITIVLRKVERYHSSQIQVYNRMK